MKKQRREESEKRRVEERRSEKRKSQKKEDADARKCRKVAKHCVFRMICGSGGSKSRLAKAAAGQMRDEKVQFVVARSCGGAMVNGPGRFGDFSRWNETLRGPSNSRGFFYPNVSLTYRRVHIHTEGIRIHIQRSGYAYASTSADGWWTHSCWWRKQLHEEGNHALDMYEGWSRKSPAGTLGNVVGATEGGSHWLESCETWWRKQLNHGICQGSGNWHLCVHPRCPAGRKASNADPAPLLLVELILQLWPHTWLLSKFSTNSSAAAAARELQPHYAAAASVLACARSP